MHSIIKEFYLGNLTPNEAKMRPSSEMAKVTAVLSETDNYLRAKLDGESLAALERLVLAKRTSWPSLPRKISSTVSVAVPSSCWTFSSARAKTPNR